VELKFVSITRPDKPNAAVLRRQKLVRRIDQQIGHVRQMIGGQNPRAAWAWMDEAGTFFLPIKYGRHSLELKKGMFAIECPDLDHTEAALCTVRAMVLQGEFDSQLAKISADIRRRFNK
jgi:endonuclease/exonuclease/phosphatase (EEP) superfamily protein YafD